MFPLCKTCADTLNRVDESHRERVRGVGNSRSVALGANNRRTVQGLRRYVFKDQTRSFGEICSEFTMGYVYYASSRR